MKKYLMTLLMLGLACNAAACMEDEPFYDTEIPPHVSIDNSKGEGVTRLVTYNVGIFNKYIKDDYQLIADMMKEIDADAICMNEQMGVGGDDSWGANVHPEYIPDVTKPVEFTFTFRGI